MPRRTDGNGWGDRSALSYDFCRQLLHQTAGSRPTAAKALQHPWVKGVVSLHMQRWESGSELAQATQNKMLCYMLAVLLAPAMLENREFTQFRMAFENMDVDHDGYISRQHGHKLLVDHGATSEAAASVVGLVDVRGTGNLDLCSAACAHLMACKFLGPTKSEPGSHAGQSGGVRGVSRAESMADLAPLMLQRLFHCYGDPRQQPPALSTWGLSTRLRTTTMNDWEAQAGVDYSEILADLPETCTPDRLAAELVVHEGRGTPLFVRDIADECEVESFWGDTLPLPLPLPSVSALSLGKLVQSLFNGSHGKSKDAWGSWC
jgi:hypothetical protein